MDIKEIKDKATELKTTIELALKKFKTETGCIATVTIETKEVRTNSGVSAIQTATVKVNVDL